MHHYYSSSPLSYHPPLNYCFRISFSMNTLLPIHIFCIIAVFLFLFLYKLCPHIFFLVLMFILFANCIDISDRNQLISSHLFLHIVLSRERGDTCDYKNFLLSYMRLLPSLAFGVRWKG